MHPMIVVYGAMVLGLLITLLLAFRGKSMQAALLATIVAAPLQLLGLTSTCTQGADGTFLTGAVFSTPFLLMAIGLLLWASYRRTLDITAGVVTLVAATALLFLTRDAWAGALLFSSPCGEMFSFYPSAPAAVLIIVGGYLLLPLLLIASAGWAVFKAVSLRGTGGSPH